MIFREMKESEISQVTELLYQAFKGYDLMESFIGEHRRNREYFLRKIQELNTRAYFAKHCVMVCEAEGRIVAASLIARPDREEIGIIDYLKAGGMDLIARFPYETFRMLSVLDKAAVPFQSQGAHWHVDELVVSPDYQGHGIGSRMLSEGIKPYIIQNGGGLLTLNTNAEINRVFYKKNGMDEFDERELQWGDWSLKSWSYRQMVPQA